MNVSKLTESIPASFDYTYKDAADVEQVETITLELKRMSFNTATSNAFRQAMENEDTASICEITSQLVGGWNIDMNGEPFPPTVENIGALPADFVGELAKCVFQRLFPNPPKADSSDNGSELAASSTAE